MRETENERVREMAAIGFSYKISIAEEILYKHHSRSIVAIISDAIHRWAAEFPGIIVILILILMILMMVMITNLAS